MKPYCILVGDAPLKTIRQLDYFPFQKKQKKTELDRTFWDEPVIKSGYSNGPSPKKHQTETFSVSIFPPKPQRE